MKISIVTATYNSAQTVRDTFNSVLSQTYGDIEYIVVDGLSTDGTTDIIREFEPRFDGRMRWVSEKDKGIYDAMNKGIFMATGDVVGVLNSDDLFFDENVVADIAAAFRDNDVDCIYGNLKFVSHDDITKVVREWKGSQHRPGAFLRGWHPAHPTFYARRECYDRYGGFDLSIDISADFDLMLRFIEKHGISNLYVNRNFIWMRTGGESTGSVRRIMRGNGNVLRSFRKNGYHVTSLYLLRRWMPKLRNLLKIKLTRACRRNK